MQQLCLLFGKRRICKRFFGVRKRLFCERFYRSSERFFGGRERIGFQRIC